ncbi:MAG: hypothetical protein JNK26_03010 [Candidatus Doudnabacteria bacterium]|nr:hypothetical protein [Candidatus Doudnabacteria bacterium]
MKESLKKLNRIRLLGLMVIAILIISGLFLYSREGFSSLGRVLTSDNQNYSRVLRWGEGKLLIGNLQTGKIFLADTSVKSLTEVLTVSRLKDISLIDENKLIVLSYPEVGVVKYQIYGPDLVLSDESSLSISEINEMTLNDNPELKMTSKYLAINGNLLFEISNLKTQIEDFVNIARSDNPDLSRFIAKGHVLKEGYCYTVEFEERFLVTIVNCLTGDAYESFYVNYPEDGDDEDFGPWNFIPLDYVEKRLLFMLERIRIGGEVRQQKLLSYENGQLNFEGDTFGQIVTATLSGGDPLLVVKRDSEIIVVW